MRAPGKDVTTDRQAQLEIEQLAAALQATGRTAQVRSYFDDEDPGLLSPDKDAVVITIGMGPDAEDGIKDVIDVVQQADQGPLEATITGEFTADDDFLTLSNKDLKEGELFFGLPAALIVLLLVFGAVVAGLIPILLAIVAIVFALALVADRRPGLGGLLLRRQHAHGDGARARRRLRPLHRQPLPRGADAGRSRRSRRSRATGRTASRAVLFSGTAFVIAMTGMLLVPDTILRSLAAGAILVGLTAVAAATTLLPAVLSLLGDRVDALRAAPSSAAAPARDGSGVRSSSACSAGRSSTCSSRPRSSSLLALPALDLRTGSAGVRTIPDGYASKDGFNALERELGVGTVDSAQIVVEGDVAAPPVRQGIERLRAELASDRGLPEPGARDRAGREHSRWSRRSSPATAATNGRCRRSSGSARRSCRRRSATRTRPSTSPARPRRSSTTAS